MKLTTSSEYCWAVRSQWAGKWQGRERERVNGTFLRSLHNAGPVRPTWWRSVLPASSLWPVDTAGLSAFTRTVRADTILFFSQVIPWSTEMLVHQHAGLKEMDWGTGLLVIMLRFDNVKYDVFRDPKTKCTCCQIDDNGQAVPIVAIFSVELECEPMIVALSQFLSKSYRHSTHKTTNSTLDHDPPTLRYTTISNYTTKLYTRLPAIFLAFTHFNNGFIFVKESPTWLKFRHLKFFDRQAYVL